MVRRQSRKTVTTPYARKTTVGVTTAVGTAVGGAFGGQYGAMGGGYAGQYVGNTVNERLAGQSPPIGRPYHYQQTQPFEPPPEQAYQEQGQSGFTDQPPPVAYPPSQYQPPQYQTTEYAYQPPVRLGRVCVTPDGLSALGPVRPLGHFCRIVMPNGFVFAGQILQ